jgi:hypothetical protein
LYLIDSLRGDEIHGKTIIVTIRYLYPISYLFDK